MTVASIGATATRDSRRLDFSPRRTCSRFFLPQFHPPQERDSDDGRDSILGQPDGIPDGQPIFSMRLCGDRMRSPARRSRGRRPRGTPRGRDFSRGRGARRLWATQGKLLEPPLALHPGRGRAAEYVGVFHYNKDLDSYLKEAAQAERELDRLFGAGVNPQQAFLDELRRPVAGLGEGQVRVAEHRGRKASRFVMRSWTTRKQFSLLPHEDAAQCRSHKQAGFEIQRAARNAIMSVNICVENSGGGGLRIWNIQPDDASRRRLGLDETGSPYPLESLDGHDSQLIDVRPGDMYCFNAKTVHAVEAMRGAQNRRATIAFLMARLDPATVLYWA